MTLHSSVVAALELPTLGAERAMLADGSVTLFAVSEALLLWNGLPRLLPVHVADTVSHVGMQVLDGHELRMEAIPNGLIRIFPCPAPPSD